MPWHVKATGWGYERTSQEAKDNCTMIMNILYSLGWGKAAICAACGNFERESVYNPWLWQGDNPIPVGDSRIGTIGGTNTAHAYGLMQSDPAANYVSEPTCRSFPNFGPNYANQTGNQSDGEAQMYYLNWVCTNYQDGSRGGWNNNHLDSIPFSTFKAQNDLSSYTMAQLVKAFHDGYERSATWSTTGSTRIAAGEYWWNYFNGYDPPTPPTPPTPSRKLPLFFYTRYPF